MALTLRLLFVLLVAAVAGTAVLAGDAPSEPDPAARFPTAWQEGAIVVPRGVPSPWIPPSNAPTDAKLALGRTLFFDKRLSRDSSRSCAHCHDPARAFTDGRRTGLGVRGQVGRRNVPTLWNAAIAPSLFWDGRAVSLEAQAEGPLLAGDELDMTEELLVERIREDARYAPLFEGAFGTPTVTLRRAAQALASFQRTLLAGDAPFDRWWFGRDEAAMTAEAKRGYEVFRTKGGCAGCHTVRPAEAGFSDFEFHATGAGAPGDPDLGRFGVTGKEEDRRRFRTPSLRQVAATAPYFHDGSAATLADVIEHYDRGGATVGGVAPELSPLRLSTTEKADLEAFLRALSSPGIAAPPPPSPPPSLAERAWTDPDPRAVWDAADARLRAAEDDGEAAAALLIVSTRLGAEDTLDDGLDRTTAAAGRHATVRAARGHALLARARLETPADPARLRAAIEAFDGAGAPRTARDALAQAYARHFLGERDPAREAYRFVLAHGDEPIADLALAGIRSVEGGTDAAFARALEDLARDVPASPAVLRARAERAAHTSGAGAALDLLLAARAVVDGSPRTRVLLARLLREAERHDEALVEERAAFPAAATDAVVATGLELLWRTRPLASLADALDLDADFVRLVDAVGDRPELVRAFSNDVAFRLRDVVATYATRESGRTQRLATGAPSEARRLLDRCVAWYDRAVAALPADAATHPFERRWEFAALANDSALMAHYWLDVRDLAKAERLYLRAFEWTDGAYTDTYHYNLQYLYGLDLPGREAVWRDLARRAASSVLVETKEGLVPDATRREAARRDAEALDRLLGTRREPGGR